MTGWSHGLGHRGGGARGRAVRYVGGTWTRYTSQHTGPKLHMYIVPACNVLVYLYAHRCWMYWYSLCSFRNIHLPAPAPAPPHPPHPPRIHRASTTSTHLPFWCWSSPRFAPRLVRQASSGQRSTCERPRLLPLLAIVLPLPLFLFRALSLPLSLPPPVTFCFERAIGRRRPEKARKTSDKTAASRETVVTEAGRTE
jgi:hypothetical protein